MAHTATFMAMPTSGNKKCKGKEISVKGVPVNNDSPIVYLKVRNAEGKNINKRGISK